MADTTTILNKTVIEGDSMNESLSTQTDGTTKAKAPRVVLMLDDGRIVGLEETYLPVSLSPHDRNLLADVRNLLSELVQLNGGISHGSK